LETRFCWFCHLRSNHRFFVTRKENFFRLTPGPADGSGKGLGKQGFSGRNASRRRYNGGSARGLPARNPRRVIHAAESRSLIGGRETRFEI
jgi:hypothetical protein